MNIIDRIPKIESGHFKLFFDLQHLIIVDNIIADIVANNPDVEDGFVTEQYKYTEDTTYHVIYIKFYHYNISIFSILKRVIEIKEYIEESLGDKARDILTLYSNIFPAHIAVITKDELGFLKVIKQGG